jgi:hypothetical protein
LDHCHEAHSLTPCRHGHRHGAIEDCRSRFDQLKHPNTRLSHADGTDLGTLNWFSVHGTSMNNTNKLIKLVILRFYVVIILVYSGDNKGYAGYLFEQLMNGNTSVVPPGLGSFVAAFA